MHVEDGKGEQNPIEPKTPEKSCKVWEEQGKWKCSFTHTESIYWSRSEEKIRRFAMLVGSNKDKIVRYKVELKLHEIKPKLT